MNENLLILGAGQYGSVVKEIARSMNCFEKIAFLDDSYGTGAAEYQEETVGKFFDYESFAGEYTHAIVAIGNPDLRREWMERLESACFRIPILVSPRAYVSESAQLRKGCIVEPLAGVHANAVIGVGTIVSMGAVINHNSTVMDYCHIDCGAIVESGALVESRRKVKSGDTVRRQSPDVTARRLIESVKASQNT